MIPQTEIERHITDYSIQKEDKNIVDVLKGRLQFAILDQIDHMVNYSGFNNPKEVEKTVENKKKFEDHPKFTDRKMKRNEPCFCESGKKYKHCHGAL